MRIESAASRKKRIRQKPAFKWQTGDFERIQVFRFQLPPAFLLLCKLWGSTPDALLSDFMQNLGRACRENTGNAEAVEHLRNYVLEMGYGKDAYSREDLLQMLAELEAIDRLWPGKAKMKFIEMHARWRDKYYHWWFKKWYRKYLRKP